MVLDREKLKEERKAKREIEKAEVGIIEVPADKLSEISHTVYLYFAAYNPEKIDKIPKILAKYRGREDELINDLFEKYGPLPGSQENNLVSVENVVSAGNEYDEKDTNDKSEAISQTVVTDNLNEENEVNLATESSSSNPVEADQNSSNEDVAKQNDAVSQANDNDSPQNDDTSKQRDNDSNVVDGQNGESSND